MVRALTGCTISDADGVRRVRRALAKISKKSGPFSFGGGEASAVAKLERLKAELSRGLSYMALEQRIAFDGAMVATVVAEGDTTADSPTPGPAPEPTAEVTQPLTFDDAQTLPRS